MPIVLKGSAVHAAFGPDAKQVATVSRDGDVLVWSIDGRTLQRELSACIRVCLSPDVLETSIGLTRAEAVAEHQVCRAQRGLPASDVPAASAPAAAASDGRPGWRPPAAGAPAPAY